jgi:methyl-accepting chemotaxis protein
VDVSRNTQANSVLVEENSTACATLADQAEQLEELAGMFRVG